MTLLNRILILSKDNKKIKDQVMKTKKDIVDNWLPRYTGRELKDFSKYILLTNFEYYLELFSELYQVPIVGADKTMPNVSCNGITLVNFGMGSPNAATILDLLSAIEPEAVLFIGKCGGIKEKNSVVAAVVVAVVLLPPQAAMDRTMQTPSSRAISFFMVDYLLFQNFL